MFFLNCFFGVICCHSDEDFESYHLKVSVGVSRISLLNVRTYLELGEADQDKRNDEFYLKYVYDGFNGTEEHFIIEKIWWFEGSFENKGSEDVLFIFRFRCLKTMKVFWTWVDGSENGIFHKISKMPESSLFIGLRELKIDVQKINAQANQSH